MTTERAAFDSVSHKFIDTALEKAGVAPKVRTMYRAIYKAAHAFTTAAGTDGKQIRSTNRFNIDRGVLRGDVTSPLFFILALELILHRHDAVSPEKGITIADTLIHILGYADDVAVLDKGTVEGCQRLSSRVTDISQGSKKDADEQGEDFFDVFKKQDAITPTTPEEAAGQCKCKFTCPHLNCGFRFLTNAGLRIHMSRCPWKDEFKVDGIVGHRGAVVSRQYKVRWKDYSQEFDTWEPRGNLHPELIKEYARGRQQGL